MTDLPSNLVPELPGELDEAQKASVRAAVSSKAPCLDAFGHMSDEWVAARVRMLMRNDLWHEPICSASRDRIIRLVLKYEALLKRFEKACARVTELESRGETGCDAAPSAAGRSAAEPSASSEGIPSEGSEPATGGAASLVVRACNAYEHGFGQFGRALDNPYAIGTPEAEAWNIGWQEAKKRAPETSVPPNPWIACADRMPTYADGKGRDMSVLGWLTDVPGDWSLAGACSVSYFNIEGWVKEDKCRFWTHLPDGPALKASAPRCPTHGVELAFAGDDCWECKREAST